MEVSGKLPVLAALPPRKEPPSQFDRLGGPHSQSGHCVEEKNLLPLP
jgi:hypothetical protein